MSTVLKWGLITGMVYVVFSLLGNLLGLQQGPGGGGNVGLSFLMNFILFLVTLFMIYLGIKETKFEDKGGYLTLGEGFITGLKISLIAAVIGGLFTLIYMLLIDPDMAERSLSAAEEQWDEANMPEESREMSRKVAGFMINPYILAPFYILWITFWGVIKSLIAGSILKKNPPVATPMT